MINYKKNLSKVAIIELVGAYGGMEIYDLSILEGLSKNIKTVHLYTSIYFSKLSGVGFDNIKMIFGGIYSKDISRLARGFMVILGLIRLVKALIKHRYQIKYCHIFTYSVLELLVVIFSCVGGGRVFVNIHDPEPFMNKSNWLIKKIFYIILSRRRFNVVTHSKYSKTTLLKNFPGVSVNVMPHTDIDYLYVPAECPECESKKVLQLDINKKYLLFFGQIKKNKGLDILIKAFFDSGIAGKGYNLLIVGRCWGEDWASYQKIINENSLSESVVVVNTFIRPEMVYHYFNSAQFVVLPYTEIFSSGVLIRASGYGKPVICSDLPAFLEEVVNGDNGIVFEAGDVTSLTIALSSATLTSDKAKSMSIKVVEKYSKKYDRYSVAEKMLEVFKL